MEKIKNQIMSDLHYCIDIANDIVANNCSPEILKYAKEFAEIESPMTDETDAPWVRINWCGVYVFVHFDEDAYFNEGKIEFIGERWYQLDFEGSYGAEIIDTDSYSTFVEELSNISEEELIRILQTWYVLPDDYCIKSKYIPMGKEK